MPSVLLTGFEPFGGADENSSQEIARNLHGLRIGRHRVEGVLLPCVFGESIRELKRQLKRVAPEIVICLGQAGGRAAITPERIAINVDDARIADNAGAQPVDRPVVRGGPASYWSTLPVKSIVRSLRAAELSAEVSQTAGTFVCNHVFYGLMHALRGTRRVRGGFIHVPAPPVQGQPALTLERMTEGIRLAIEATIRVRRDPPLPGGQVE